MTWLHKQPLILSKASIIHLFFKYSFSFPNIKQASKQGVPSLVETGVCYHFQLTFLLHSSPKKNIHYQRFNNLLLLVLFIFRVLGKFGIKQQPKLSKGTYAYTHIIMAAAQVVFKSSSNLFISQPCRLHHHASSKSLKSSESSSSSSSLVVSRSSSPSSNSQFYGQQIILVQPPATKSINPQASNSQIKMSLCIGKARKWWEKGLQSNMTEITSAQHLVDSLSNSGDQLVVLDFFSPGCGGCKALHPKICQLAEMNPEVQFLQVNYEEHKSMCYSLNVHVLPFFRFYRGAQGRVCSFSCTNATIKKFKDALAKHSPDRCSLGPAKGLEEKELLALSANKDLSFSYTPKPVEAVPVKEQILAETTAAASQSNSMPPLLDPSTFSKESEDKTLVTTGR